MLVIALLCLVGISVPVRAQDSGRRSSTGRHRPPPVAQTEAEAAARGGLEERSGWFAGLAAGVMTGGDLWRVATVNDVTIPWVSAVRFSSPRFNATLASNFAAGLMFGRRLGDRWSVRLDLSSSRMDVTAEAPQGQKAGVFGYDRLTMTAVALTGEVKLAPIPSAPYVSFGVLGNRVRAAREVDLNQTRYGYRLGLGYLQRLTSRISLRGEGRYSRTGFETGNYLPKRAPADGIQPELEFTPADDLNLFELVGVVQLDF